MAKRADRRAARGGVSTYSQVQLAELLNHAGAVTDRYSASEIGAYAVDETIRHYHLAGAGLRTFWFAHGGFIAGLPGRMTSGAEAIDWCRRATGRRHQCHHRAALPVCGVPRLSQTAAHSPSC